MRKESFQGILLGIVIMCAVFAFITVAWAALSSTLTINGTATIAASKWQVEFSDTSAAVLSGSTATCSNASTNAVCATSNAPVLTTTTFGANSGATLGTLSNINDKLVYTWYIVNNGTFDAYVNNIVGADNTDGKVTLTCTSDVADDNTGDAASKSANFCKALEATIKLGSTPAAPAYGTKIDKKVESTLGSKLVTLELVYKGSDDVTASNLPVGNITVSLNSTTGISMNFAQVTTTPSAGD